MKHQYQKVWKFFILFLALFAVSSCAAQPNDDLKTPQEDTNKPKKAAILDTPIVLIDESEGTPAPIVMDYLKISIENAEELQLRDTFSPFYPEMVSISGNQEIIAVGNLTGVKVFSSRSGREIAQIKVELPDCQFGYDSYIQLNYDGNFLAITTLGGVEVWQVGGGIIYQSPYMHGRVLDRLTCGMDIPQIALSPNGRFLMESGMVIGDKGYTSYFQVIDILQNEIVYTWDGRPESMHGQFYTFPSLGFSQDSAMVQIFNPVHFASIDGKQYSAFEYWSIDDWLRYENDSDEVLEAFSPGERLFSMVSDGNIQVIGKGSGEKIWEIDIERCSSKASCSTIFSPDGSKVAILIPSEDVQYKREKLITEIQIFNLNDGELFGQRSTLIRNRNSVRLQDDGSLFLREMDIDMMPVWWTNTAYFSGFKKDDGDRIVFFPQEADVSAPAPMYSHTCSIDTESLKNECMDGVLTSIDIILTVEHIQQGFIIRAGKEALTQVKYPMDGSSDTWQIRLLEYHADSGIGYFCLDRNQREETCVIMKMEENEIVEEQIDLFGLVFSRELGKVVFINREKKALLLFDEENGSQKQMSSYWAIAYPVKPAVIQNGSELLYFVRDLETDNIYIEKVGLEQGKVIKRFDFENLEEFQPSAIAVNPDEDVWVVGDEEGNLLLLDPQIEAVLGSVKASSSSIVDLIFDSGGENLLSIDQRGVISVWAVRK